MSLNLKFYADMKYDKKICVLFLAFLLTLLVHVHINPMCTWYVSSLNNEHASCKCGGERLYGCAL
jgi:hypothetical protein